MNRYRQKHPDHVKAVAKPALDVGDDTDTELTSAADDIYAEAAKHRETVIAKDKAAKARKKKGRG
jgi:hypothetical protein